MKKVKRLFLSAICLLIVSSALSQEKRNLLTDFYTRKFVSESITRDDSWIKYPAYSNREAWLKVPERVRHETIARGENYLGYNWPAITATMYLEFTRSGDRTAVDIPNGERAKALQTLVLAELMEGKGRFLDDIINGVFSFCEQTYWGSSAHFYLYEYGGSIENPRTVIPDKDDPIIDLVTADRAADLAWVWYYFHDEFDKISPVISRRLKEEIKEKVLDPFYKRYDLWWITGWGQGNVNNWTPWCNFNMLTCILLMEDDPVKKQDGIYKTMASVDLFINSYADDGGCDEGPSYWGVAGGKLFDYLNLLKENTKGRIDIFDNELVRNIGRYIYRAYISNGSYYINFGDAPLKIHQDPGRIFRFGENIKDSKMKGFGAFLQKKSADGQGAMVGKIGETLENLFNLQQWQDARAIEPLVSEYYFPDLDLVMARETAGTTNGFYFAAKGGSNGDSHNHNDVGSFMLYFNGAPVLIDVGVGTYTRKTFSAQRYDIWTMQSNYHNLPVINGIGQSAGGRFKAQESKYISTKNKVSFSTDIARAYPSEAKVNRWIRSYTLERGKKFLINDNFQLAENTGNNSFHFMTGLPCRIVNPGILEFDGNDFTVRMKYNPSALTASIESIKIDDKRLLGVLGEKISRVVFDLKGNSLSGNVSFELTGENSFQ